MKDGLCVNDGNALETITDETLRDTFDDKLVVHQISQAANPVVLPKAGLFEKK